MAEIRRKLGNFWLRKNRADIPVTPIGGGGSGLGNGALGTMPLGGS